MQGDFSRNTFDALNHYSRVLMQQGRVQIDADWNEQASILLHYLRTLACDLVGPHGGPIENCGFEVAILSNQLNKNKLMPGSASLSSTALESMKKQLDSNTMQRADFLITKGRYYVDGFLCENDEAVWYSKQPHLPLSALLNLAESSPCVVYLDVWEQHVSAIDNHTIREVALGGTDTTTRAKVMWQVRTKKLLKGFTLPEKGTPGEIPEWDDLLNTWQPKNRGSLKVRAIQSETTKRIDPSAAVSLESKYRDLDNQLYRIEVHRGGSASDATFKWSRENGAVLFSVEKAPDDTVITVLGLGKDSRFALTTGDWVEILGDGHVFPQMGDDNQEPHPLLQITQIDSERGRITTNPPFKALTGHVKQFSMRRWDHKARDQKRGGSTLLDGAVRIQEGHGNQSRLLIEHGVEIQFQKMDPAAQYRSGDYWLIAARTATADVEWSQRPEGEPPHGIHHHYAPLAVISANKDSSQIFVADYRKWFEGISSTSKRKEP